MDKDLKAIHKYSPPVNNLQHLTEDDIWQIRRIIDDHLTLLERRESDSKKIVWLSTLKQDLLSKLTNWLSGSRGYSESFFSQNVLTILESAVFLNLIYNGVHAEFKTQGDTSI